MVQLTPQSRIFIAVEPVDFRKGIDGLAAVCRQTLAENPLAAVYVFRNRAGTTLKLLVYDGQGFWLCTKRLSQGRFRWWTIIATPSLRLTARELSILLWNENPERAQLAPRLASGRLKLGQRKRSLIGVIAGGGQDRSATADRRSVPSTAAESAGGPPANV